MEKKARKHSFKKKIIPESGGAKTATGTSLAKILPKSRAASRYTKRTVRKEI